MLIPEIRQKGNLVSVDPSQITRNVDTRTQDASSVDFGSLDVGIIRGNHTLLLN